MGNNYLPHEVRLDHLREMRRIVKEDDNQMVDISFLVVLCAGGNASLQSDSDIIHGGFIENRERSWLE